MYLFTPRPIFENESWGSWLWHSITFHSADHINAASGIFLVTVGYLTWFISTHSFFWGKPLTNKSALFQYVLKIEEPANLELASERIHKLARSIMALTLLFCILVHFTIWAVLPVRDVVLPYIIEKLMIAQETAPVETNPIFHTPVNLTVLSWFILSLCMIPTLMLLFFVKRRWDEHTTKDDLKRIFFSWKWANRYVSAAAEVQKDPINIDVVIGVDRDTKEVVIQNGADRNLNNAIGGSIGTGKTSATMIPILNQDMDHMCRLINHVNWKVLIDNLEEDAELIEAELRKMSQGLNGMIIVEPSNDLCQKLYQLAKAHDIPEEAIYYVNPIDPNSMTINALRGPVEKAVESFTMVIQGLAKDQDDFFKQAQRSHLKHYLYLLKLEKKNEALFDDLIDMYHDTRIVWEMMERVERTIPADWELIKNRDERNHWYIVKGIVAWFRERGLQLVADRNGIPVIYPQGHKHAGKQMVVDKQEQHVGGLKNILDDIAANMLIRRVLFGNSDFDIDTHLRAGGILLVNTAMGDLSDLHNTFGQMIISLTQNGIFRRGIWTRPDGSKYTDLEKESYQHILIDEFPEYVYEQFRRLPANSRKQRTIITVAFQSLSQLSIDFGDDFTDTFMSTFRHKMVYADVDKKTATLFSDYFGEEEKFKEDTTEQYVPQTMDDPGRRDSFAMKKERELRMTPSDIMNLGAFEAAVRLVERNQVNVVRVVKAVFVRMKYFKRAKVRANRQQAQDWLLYRKKMMLEFERSLLKDSSILHEGHNNPKDTLPQETIVREVKKAYSHTAEKTVLGPTETMIIESDMSIEEMFGLIDPSKKHIESPKQVQQINQMDSTDAAVNSNDIQTESIEAVNAKNHEAAPSLTDEDKGASEGSFGETKIESSDMNLQEIFQFMGPPEEKEEQLDQGSNMEDEEISNEGNTPASERGQNQSEITRISLDFSPEDIIVEDVVKENEQPLSEQEIVNYLNKPSEAKGKRIKL